MIDYKALLDKKLLEYKDKQIYLYGAGNMGGVAYSILTYYGIHVAGYIVTKGGAGFLNGLPIKNVSEYQFDDTKDIKIILTLNDAYHSEVKKYLHAKGVYDIDDSFSTAQIFFFSEIFRDVFKEHGVDINQNILTIGDLRIPNPYMYEEMSPFWLECGDIILPPFFQEDRFICEGKYEYGPVAVKAGDVVLDCGANIGLFSSYAASKNCTAYAFEPLEDQLGNTLRLCSELNGNRISHIPFALSDYQGTAEFNVSHLTQGSSFLSDVSSESKNKVIENVVPVNVTTVDSFVNTSHLSKVDFIKADIEGAERQMLKGAAQVLREFAPKLAICTYHYPDDPQVLEEIIKEANPQYKVIHKWKKLFAYV